MARGSIAARSITVIHRSIAVAPRSAAALGWEHYSKPLAAAPHVLDRGLWPKQRCGGAGDLVRAAVWEDHRWCG
jgi:hypothetical protein